MRRLDVGSNSGSMKFAGVSGNNLCYSCTVAIYFLGSRLNNLHVQDLLLVSDERQCVRASYLSLHRWMNDDGPASPPAAVAAAAALYCMPQSVSLDLCKTSSRDLKACSTQSLHYFVCDRNFRRTVARCTAIGPYVTGERYVAVRRRNGSSLHHRRWPEPDVVLPMMSDTGVDIVTSSQLSQSATSSCTKDEIEVIMMSEIDAVYNNSVNNNWCNNECCDQPY